jgi:hypothetical protein
MTTHHRIARSLAVTLALALGVGTAPAVGRTFDVNANGSPIPTGTYTTGHPSAPAYSSRTEPIARISPPSGGFDWGDAGIGAAAGFSVSMIGVGGALATSRRRGRRTRGTALTS